MKRLIASFLVISAIETTLGVEVRDASFSDSGVGMNFRLPFWLGDNTISGVGFFWLTNSTAWRITRKEEVDMLSCLDAQMEREIVPNSWLYLKDDESRLPSINTVPFPQTRLQDIDWVCPTNGISTNSIVLGLTPSFPLAKNRNLSATNRLDRFPDIFRRFPSHAFSGLVFTSYADSGLPIFGSTKLTSDVGFTCGPCELDDYLDAIIDHVTEGGDWSIGESGWGYEMPGFVNYGAPFDEIEYSGTDRWTEESMPEYGDFLQATGSEEGEFRYSTPRATDRVTRFDWGFIATMLAMADRTWYTEDYGFVPDITHTVISSSYSSQCEVRVEARDILKTNNSFVALLAVSKGSNTNVIENVITNIYNSRSRTVFASGETRGNASIKGIAGGVYKISAARYIRGTVSEHYGELGEGRYRYEISYIDGVTMVTIYGKNGDVFVGEYPTEVSPLDVMPEQGSQLTLYGLANMTGSPATDIIPAVEQYVLREGDNLRQRGCLPMRKPATTFRSSHVAQVHAQHFVTTYAVDRLGNATTNYEALCRSAPSMDEGDNVCWAMAYDDCENAKRFVGRGAASYGNPMSRSVGSATDAFGGMKNELEAGYQTITVGGVQQLALYVEVDGEGNISFLDKDMNEIDERDDIFDDIATHVRSVGVPIEFGMKKQDYTSCTKELSFTYIVDWKWFVLPLE